MTTKFLDQLSRAVLIPEDFGAIGYVDQDDAANSGTDNTVAMQKLADAVWQRRERAFVPELYYPCNSTVHIPVWGEFVMHGSILTRNTNITAIRLYGRIQFPTTAGSKTIVSAWNWMSATHANPLWLTKTYAPAFDTTMSVRKANLLTYSGSVFYRLGEEVYVTGDPATRAYRCLVSNAGQTPSSSPAYWKQLDLSITDGGGQTVAQRLAAEVNIGILCDTMFTRTVEMTSVGYTVGVGLKPRTVLGGYSACGFNTFMIHEANSAKFAVAIITGGQLNWVNSNRFITRSLHVGNTINIDDKGIYGLTLMNDDALGSYYPNGNTFDSINIEHVNSARASEFVQVLVRDGQHNTFTNVRSDFPDHKTVHFMRHASEVANPNFNEVTGSVRLNIQGVHSNGYENRVLEAGVSDVLSLEFNCNDLFNRLVYSGNDLVTVKGLGFWQGTGYARWDVSEHCFKLHNRNRIYAMNYPLGITIYPGRRQWNTYWTLSVRGKGGRYGFHCFDVAGSPIGRSALTPSSALVQNGTVTFPEVSFLGQPWQQLPDDYDDSDIKKDRFNHVQFTFHEIVNSAVFSLYGPDIEGYTLRAYNAPGAQVTSPLRQNLGNIIKEPPQKGEYHRPWEAMYEQTPGGGVQRCVLDVGTSAFPVSWATSGPWTSGQPVTRRNERHVVAGSDYRIYRAQNTGGMAGSAPTHTTVGQIVADGGGVNWEYLTTAEQLAAFVDI